MNTAAAATLDFLRERQYYEDRLRDCPSLYGPHNGDGTCRTRQFTGLDGLSNLGAVAPRRITAGDFKATIQCRRFGPVVIGELQHSCAVSVEPRRRFGHNHDVSRMMLSNCGPLMVETSSHRMQVDPGGGLMVSGDTPFKYRSSSSVSMLFIDFATDDPVFAGITDRKLALWNMQSPSISALAAFVRSVLHSELDEMPYQERVALRCSLENLVLGTLLSSDAPRADQAVDSVYLRAMETIRQLHRNPDFTVDDVARRVGVSRRTLQRAFSGGHGVSEWINRMRLDDALMFLRSNTTESMEECARRAGFGSTMTMRRAVLAATGYTPTEYRRRESLKTRS